MQQLNWQLLPAPLLYLSAYFDANRSRYYELLMDVSRKGNWEAWLTFFLQGIATQSFDAIQRMAQLQSLRETYRSQLQRLRTGAKLLKALDVLFARPVITVQQISTTLEVSPTTAGKYITRLENAGILQEITGQSRTENSGKVRLVK